MSDFIFEEEVRNIPNLVIRDYLSEVISCYNMGFFRSAIVSLHNVVMYDLIYKLRTLSEFYQDQKAKDLLSELGDKSTNVDENYSEWEKKLFVGVKQTKLLDEQEAGLVWRLREDRHHCAHPALKDMTLFIPNKDQTRAHIRNMFEVVFLKDTILAKDIITPILEDIRTYFSELGGYSNAQRFSQYLTNQYYSKLNQKAEKELFRTLWSFVFKKQGEPFNDNRHGCYQALVTLVERDRSKFLGYLREEPTFFNNISVNEGEAFVDTSKSKAYLKVQNVPFMLLISPQAFLLFFLSEYPNFYPDLRNLVTVLEHEADKNINLFVRLFFMKNSFEEHLVAIRQYRNDILGSITTPSFWEYEKCDTSIDKEQFDYLFKQAELRNSMDSLINFSLEWLKSVTTFDSATYVIQVFVLPLLDKMNTENLMCLIDIMDNNNQVYSETKQYHLYLPVIRDKVVEILGEDFPINDHRGLRPR